MHMYMLIAPKGLNLPEYLTDIPTADCLVVFPSILTTKNDFKLQRYASRINC